MVGWWFTLFFISWKICCIAMHCYIYTVFAYTVSCTLTLGASSWTKHLFWAHLHVYVEDVSAWPHCGAVSLNDNCGGGVSLAATTAKCTPAQSLFIS